MSTSGRPPSGVTALSADILEVIFRYLNVFQLKNVRLTCHAWRRIVDESRLLADQLAFTIRCKTLERSFEPPCPLPVNSVSIFQTTVICVNHWWPDLGATLSHLYLRHCRISLPMISELLRQTPNLNNLGFKDIFLLNSFDLNWTTASFRLEKLTHFSLCNIPEPVANLIRRLIYPGLECFGCAWETYMPQDEEGLIIDFFRDSQDTLKTTRLTPTAFMLAGIGSLRRLKLQDVTIWCNSYEIEHVINFTLMQTSIEKLNLLDLELPELVVLHICANLPGLKHLTVLLEYVPIWKPSSLFAITPNLEHLEVKIMGFSKFTTSTNYRHYRTKTVGDFRDCCAPKLREINLTDIYPSTNLQTFLRQSRNLHTVLLDFACDDFSNLASTIPIVQLRSLTLRSLTILTPPPDLGPYEKLRRLALYHVRASKSTLTRLLAGCPRLEDIVIFWIAGDDEVRLICERFTRLRKLELHECPITDRSVDAVLTGCRALEQLTLHGCNGLSRAGRMHLRNTAKFCFVDGC